MPTVLEVVLKIIVVIGYCLMETKLQSSLSIT